MKPITLSVFALIFLCTCKKTVTNPNDPGNTHVPFENSYIIVNYHGNTYQFTSDTIGNALVDCYFDGYEFFSLTGIDLPTNRTFELKLMAQWPMSEDGTYNVSQTVLYAGDTSYKTDLNGNISFDYLNYLNYMYSAASGSFQAGYDRISNTYALTGSFYIVP